MLYNNKLDRVILNLHTKTFFFLNRIKLLAKKSLELTFQFFSRKI